MGQQTTAGIFVWEDIGWQDCKTKNTARLGLERSRCSMGRRIRSASSLRWKIRDCTSTSKPCRRRCKTGSMGYYSAKDIFEGKPT